jgi:hypothetical protein
LFPQAAIDPFPITALASAIEVVMHRPFDFSNGFQAQHSSE